MLLVPLGAVGLLRNGTAEQWGVHVSEHIRTMQKLMVLSIYATALLCFLKALTLCSPNAGGGRQVLRRNEADVGSR
jgi:hypothetical protein